ncbi:MAG TPA: chromate transporter [Clostridiaceae bacterium]|nr:chromate transporter [Clostridiaceae bacterium]
MIFLKLFITFFKIGIFSFGGGYAMIPFIEKEIHANGWLTSSEFLDIIAIAEMTPGPIAINSATFVGYKTAGFFGGFSATLGVSMPSVLLILLVSQFFFKYREHAINKAIFYGIRPVVAGLILSAAIFVARTALLNIDITSDFINKLFSNPMNVISIGSLFILGVTLVVLIKYKLHPILTVVISGIIGVVLYHVFPGLGIVIM